MKILEPMTTQKAEIRAQQFLKFSKIFAIIALCAIVLLALIIAITAIVDSRSYGPPAPIAVFTLNLGSEYAFVHFLIVCCYIGAALLPVGIFLYFFGLHLFTTARVAANSEKIVAGGIAMGNTQANSASADANITLPEL